MTHPLSVTRPLTSHCLGEAKPQPVRHHGYIKMHGTPSTLHVQLHPRFYHPAPPARLHTTMPTSSTFNAPKKCKTCQQNFKEIWLPNMECCMRARLEGQVSPDFFEKRALRDVKMGFNVRHLHSFVTHNTESPFSTLQVYLAPSALVHVPQSVPQIHNPLVAISTHDH